MKKKSKTPKVKVYYDSLLGELSWFHPDGLTVMIWSSHLADFYSSAWDQQSYLNQNENVRFEYLGEI